MNQQEAEKQPREWVRCLNQHWARWCFHTTAGKNSPLLECISHLDESFLVKFIIELRLRKYSLSHCQLPEDAALKVFRCRWDSRFLQVFRFSSWRVKMCMCVGVYVCACECTFHIYHVFVCVRVCICLINSRVHRAPSAYSVFDRAAAGCEGPPSPTVRQTTERKTCSLSHTVHSFPRSSCVNTDFGLLTFYILTHQNAMIVWSPPVWVRLDWF